MELSEFKNENDPQLRIEVEGLPLQFEKSLSRFFELNSPGKFELEGTQSSLALGALLSNQLSCVHKKRPQLICTATDEEAEKLKKQIHFFSPLLEVYVLAGFDVSPYSGLYPNRRRIASRLNWLFHAQKARPGQIFIASIEALLQKTLPFKILNDNCYNFKINDSIPDNLSQFFEHLGYQPVPLVEDLGTYSIRGNIVDFFSPAHAEPIRLELFADLIETAKYFDPETQRSQKKVTNFSIIPASEVLFNENQIVDVIKCFKQNFVGTTAEEFEIQEITRQLTQGNYFHGIDFLLGSFYPSPVQPLEHFCCSINLWILDSVEVTRQFDSLYAQKKQDYKTSENLVIRPPYSTLYAMYDEMAVPDESYEFLCNKISVRDSINENSDETFLKFSSSGADDLAKGTLPFVKDPIALKKYLEQKLSELKSRNYDIFVACSSSQGFGKTKDLLKQLNFQVESPSDGQYLWNHWRHQQQQNKNVIHVLPWRLHESIKLPSENLAFLRDEDFFGKRRTFHRYRDRGSLQQRAHALSFGDLKPGDLVVHKMHGIGKFNGLKIMPIGGIDAEFIELEYKGNDKLFLPVYRVGQVQKYSGPSNSHLIDKLGSTNWQKTQVKVRNQLRDIASELLKLYSLRKQLSRPAFSMPGADFVAFENAFPFAETDDQQKSINDVLTDMTSEKPMDRLICGDVGFGKTEIAMRATFKAVEDGKQVAIIAPTTILTFQHLRNFISRMKNWPISIKALNRFVNTREQKVIIDDIKNGRVDIVIGTHRLLSKDVEFKNLGLLIIDEEQKFGVKHKEKIRHMKHSVDTLAMSATPIPRTLNMSLMGIRDLSIINTPPVDRLPTRTFICKFDRETIRKAIRSELERGGQIFFLHNRVHSIYALQDELRSFLPDVRMEVAHGQMPEGDLEKTMLRFFNHEIDMLICTTIIESGMDIPKANTMFIDNAHQLGLSQLYQLRGRVGRSKERAYCYLLVPKNLKLDPVAQERLKVIQENSALGSGIQVAQHDLELRGAGDILGEDQSGQINAVGYELYMELLEQAVHESRGEPLKQELEPEINVKIPALIPDQYISDIRIRLAFYKALSEIEDEQDIDRIEEELRDQFGKPPEPVVNLLGLMLIRRLCKEIQIKDISTGKGGISLKFTDDTPLPVDRVIRLTMQDNKKYTLAPDNRLIIRMKEILWPRIYDELLYLKSLVPK